MSLGKPERTEAAIAIARGVLAAAAVTLLGMAALAAILVLAGMSDSFVLTVNQGIKVVSIFLGVLAAVGPGGRRGFATGAVVGVLYMALGYALYCLLDGALLSPALLAMEFALGAALGALSGAIAANLRPRRRRRTRKAA